jgi:hypothetical protein
MLFTVGHNYIEAAYLRGKYSTQMMFFPFLKKHAIFVTSRSRQAA